MKIDNTGDGGTTINGNASNISKLDYHMSNSEFYIKNANKTIKGELISANK